MAPVTKGANPVSAYTSKLDVARRQIVLSVLDLIREAAPAAEETCKWNTPVFFQNGLVCFVAAHKHHVNLGFYKGAHLDDPKGLLEGTGKGMRHFKIRTARDIRPAQFKKWIKAAVKLNAK